jgi:hypothetical protein
LKGTHINACPEIDTTQVTEARQSTQAAQLLENGRTAESFS